MPKSHRLLTCCAFLFLCAVCSADPIWFSHGISSVDIGDDQAKNLTSQSCLECHPAVHADWSRSRHAQAWTNAIFQEGFHEQPLDRCVFCHAPLKEQLKDFRTKKKPGLHSEGVNCAVCHIREGKIFGSQKKSSSAHPVESTNIKSSEFCAGCHQFNFAKKNNAGVVTQNLAAQNTYLEWLEYAKDGDAKTCQQCHMPGGRHVFLGAHDFQFLSAAISLTWVSTDQKVEFFLKSVGVGHNVPTGDVFRHLTLEVRVNTQDDWKTVAWIGRRYRTVKGENGNYVQSLIEDSTLRPREKRKITVLSAMPLFYRLVYHYTGDTNEKKSVLTASDLISTLQTGRTGP